MKQITKIVGFLAVCLSSQAEMRVWTHESGQQFEAEYIAIQAGKVLTRDANGKDIRMPLGSLSEADRRFVELENPPTITVDFIESFDQRDPRPSPIWVNNSPVHVFHYSFGARVKQKSAGMYNHELSLEIFAIGQQELDRDKYRLLSRISSEPFVLSKENGREFELRDDGIVKLMRYKLAGEYPRGERFAENLILVKDERGEIIGYNSTRNWLFENRDKLENLPVGAWFNEDCVRVHPTSPKDLLAD